MKKQKFSYHFTPAGITSNFVPLLVILYGRQDIDLKYFEYKMWNVLQVCSYNIEDKANLQELIIEYSESYECEEYVFTYGDIESVEGAILEGIISKENTLYASSSELKDRAKIKKVLDEFEKMSPEL